MEFEDEAMDSRTRSVFSALLVRTSAFATKMCFSSLLAAELRGYSREGFSSTHRTELAAVFGIRLSPLVHHHDDGVLGTLWSASLCVFLAGLHSAANGSVFRFQLFVVGEFMVTFLHVFTGLEPAANSVSDFSSMARFATGLDAFLGRSLSSFRSTRTLSMRQDISVQPLLSGSREPRRTPFQDTWISSGCWVCPTCSVC